MEGDPLERPRDRLDVGMVGRDAEAHEPPRGRQPVDEVDLDDGILAGAQRAGRIEPGGPGADDGHAKWVAHARILDLSVGLQSGTNRQRMRGASGVRLKSDTEVLSVRAARPAAAHLRSLGELLALLDLER